MSVEFVEDPPPAPRSPVDPTRPGSPAAPGTPPAPHAAAHGRFLAGVWAAAAVLAGLSLLPTLYQWRQSVVVVDFDHSTTHVNRVDVDAFGHVSTGGALVAPDGVGGTPYGRVWIVLAVALLAVAAWGLLRPRSRRPAVAAAVLGAVLLGTVGALGLELWAASGQQAASVRLDRVPAAGYWLALAAALLATVVGGVAALGPGRPDRAVRARWAVRRPRGGPSGLDLQ